MSISVRSWKFVIVIIVFFSFVTTISACGGGNGGSGFAKFGGYARKLPAAKPTAGSDDALPDIADDAPELMNVEAPPTPPTLPPVELPPLPPTISAISVSNPEQILKKGITATVRWTVQDAGGTPARFLVRLVDSLGAVVDEKSGEASEFASPNEFAFQWNTGLSDEVFRLDISGENTEGASLDLAVARVVVRAMAPEMRMYLAASQLPDDCVRPTFSPGQVATRVIPFRYCVREPHQTDAGQLVRIGIERVCFRTAGPGQVLNTRAPAQGDTCWLDPDSAPTSFQLDVGLTEVVGFARDAAGNIAKVASSVVMEPGEPPRIDILEPTGSQIVTAPWTSGGGSANIKRLRWLVTHPTTRFNDMRFIVTLIDVTNEDATSPQWFRHLACNFKNDPAFQQCPSPELENSPLIRPVTTYHTYPSGVNADNRGEGEAEFRFTIPSDWDPLKKYVLAVTAIDRAGNAAVASTQEINVGWEVVAGRTYRGLGGSGKTLQREGDGGNYIRADRLGRLFENKTNLTLDALDYRSCRTFANNDAHPFDCRHTFSPRLNVNNYVWEYNPDRDTFYSYGKSGSNPGEIVEIDFNKKTMNTIFGGAGKTAIPTTLPSGARAADYSASSLRARLFYLPSNKKLFFRTAGRLYSIDTAGAASGTLRYVLGSGTEAIEPTNPEKTPQNQLILPNGDHPFVVTSDRRFLVGGAARQDQTQSSGLGNHYMVSDFSYSSAAQQSDFFSITPAPMNRGKLDDVAYDHVNNIIYATLSYRGVYKLNLASIPKSDAVASYSWEQLTGRVSSPMEEDYLQKADQTTPHNFYSLSQSLSLVNPTLLYFNNKQTGSVLMYDLQNNRIERLLGFPAGREGDQVAQNRYITSPRNIVKDKYGNILFSDYFRLQKASYNSARSVWEIATLKHGFPEYAFRYDASTHALFMARRAALNIWNLDGISDASLPIAKAPAPALYDGRHDSHHGMGQSTTRPVIAWLNSTHNSQLDTYVKTRLWAGIFASFNGTSIGAGTTLSLSAVEPLNSSFCGDGTETCPPNALVTGQNYYVAANFRIERTLNIAANVSKKFSTIAFNNDDTRIYLCVNEKFTEVTMGTPGQPATQTIIHFKAKVGNPILTCDSTHAGGLYSSLFQNIKVGNRNDIYFVEERVARAYRMLNAPQIVGGEWVADFAEVATLRGTIPSASIQGFTLDEDYFYYSDMKTDRVIRNRRQ